MANMSKAERKAAIKAAKAAAKKSEIKVDNTTKVEETKVEAPQVDNKEVKKEVKPEIKTEVKESKVEKKDTQKEPKKRTEKIPIVIPEDNDVDLNGKKGALDRAAKLISAANGIPMSASPTSSLDGKAMLAHVMWEKYGKNEELKNQYPNLYNDLMQGIDVVTLLALVDVRQELLNRNSKGELNLVIDSDKILPLQNMAEMLGIKLAPAKALPGSDGKQLEIDFAKSEVPKELTPEKRPNRIPELDPNKILDDEMLKDALHYIITKTTNVAENIADTVEWYRVFCGLKETDANKKLALDDKSVGEWMEEIFKIIQPSSIMNGLGRSTYLYTRMSGSPCMAHAILHSHLNKLNWTEEQIAEMLKVLVTENFRYKLKDDENLDPTNDEALTALNSTFTQDYIDKLFVDYDIDLAKVAEADRDEAVKAKNRARMIIGAVRNNYYEKIGKSASIPELKVLVGRILNLYRDPADRLAEYCSDVVIMPDKTDTIETKTENKKK